MKSKQGGAVLATALIILFILTLFAVTAMHTSVFEERMSSNTSNHNQAFYAAESALTEAQQVVSSFATLPLVSASCSAQPCVYALNPSIDLSQQSTAWWQSNATPFGSSAQSKTALPNVSTQPYYRIEYLRFVPDSLDVSATTTGTYFYRITAMGAGPNSNSSSVVQITIGKRF